MLETKEEGRAEDKVRGTYRMVLLRDVESPTLEWPEGILPHPTTMVRREVVFEVAALPGRVVLVTVDQKAVLTTRGRVGASPLQARLVRSECGRRSVAGIAKRQSATRWRIERECSCS